MAHGAVRILLRLEGLVAIGLSVSLCADHGRGWLAFALLFLTPDLSLAGYLVGPRGGSTISTSCIPIRCRLLWHSSVSAPLLSSSRLL